MTGIWVKTSAGFFNLLEKSFHNWPCTKLLSQYGYTPVLCFFIGCGGVCVLWPAAWTYLFLQPMSTNYLHFTLHYYSLCIITKIAVNVTVNIYVSIAMQGMGCIFGRFKSAGYIAIFLITVRLLIFVFVISLHRQKLPSVGAF